MNTPLLPPVIGFAAGIVFGSICPIPIEAIFAIAFLIASAFFLARTKRDHLLLPICFVVGWTNVATRTAIVSPHDLRIVAGDQPALARLRGTLASEPMVKLNHAGEPDRWRAVIEVISVNSGSGASPAIGILSASSPGPPPTNFHSGAIIEAFGILARPPTAAANGLFNYRETLRRQGIHHLLKTQGIADWTLIEPSSSRRYAARIREWTREKFAIGAGTEDKSLRLLWAMFLGWRSALTEDVSEPFKRSGTMHVFAISGLHIGLISAILLALLRTVRVPRAVSGLLVLGILIFYCAITEWQISSVRATTMTGVVVLGWSFQRPFNLLNSLAAAALCILAFDPLQLLQVGFQLSFAVVLSISVLLPRFDRLKERLFQADPFLPEELVPRYQLIRLKCGRFVFTLFAVSLAAWLGSLPLIALHFHLFTPGSLIANPLVVLCAAATVASAIGAVLTIGWFPFVGSCFVNSAWWWIECQTWLSERVAGLPGTWWHISGPSPIGLVLYYALLIALAVPACWKKQSRQIGTSAVLASLVVIWIGTRLSEPAARIAILGNNANAIYCDLPGSPDDLLIDCGRTAGYHRLVRPFLRAQGLNRLPAFLLSHGDIRHIEAFDDLVREWNPDQVYLSTAPQRSPGYRKIEENLNQKTNTMHRVSAGDLIGTWKVLHPQRDATPKRADDGALVVRSTIAGWRILIAPDLGEKGQSKLLSSTPDLHADVLITGTPTAGGAATYGLVHALKPKFIIIHDNLFPFNDRASRSLRSRLRKYGVPTFYTSDHSSLHLEISQGTINLRAGTGNSLFKTD